MLHVHEDDPDRRRLVLRAPAPGLGDVGRRVLASVLAVAPVLIALAWTWMSEPRWHSAWLVPVGLGVAAWITGRFATEVTELGFDGGAGQAWVEERGHRIWGTRRRAQPLSAGDGLAFRGGVLTGQPHQLGVVMELAGRAFTPAFVVEGVERRAELVDLVERLAGRIGREVLPQRDDVDVLRLYCGAEGAPSPAHRGAARSYRRRCSRSAPRASPRCRLRGAQRPTAAITARRDAHAGGRARGDRHGRADADPRAAAVPCPASGCSAAATC
ncbi:MAG: hypothetical protein IPH72_32790 [Sandaracinaceae bacterium]|nr:hypothetical protein [Sandaracinaceae bacterium]